MKQNALAKQPFQERPQNGQTVVKRHATIPSALVPFAEPMLLPSESIEHYNAVSDAMIDDLKPANNIEWLWTLDLIELNWETLRYRRLKAETLVQCRQLAIESLLVKAESRGLPVSGIPSVLEHARRHSLEWTSDPNAAAEIEDYLERHGFGQAKINAEVYIQAQDAFLMFDGLLQSGRNRIMSLLREMSIRREFAKRARLASEKLI